MRVVAAATAVFGLVGAMAATPPNHGSATPSGGHRAGSSRVVRPLASLQEQQAKADAMANATFYDPEHFAGSLFNTAKVVGADEFWKAGSDGTGVDVALIDTGVAPVEGLGSVINGPDFSLDAGAGQDGLDEYGHGTHLAGIIAGHDAGYEDTKIEHGVEPDKWAKTHYAGIAPGARIVNVRVGAADGAADVSQLITAIGWTVEHAHTDGLNIRVINLSVGTSGVQDYRTDPLTYAVERAWRAGIVVVVAAGNDGATADLADPAYDPFVVTVGASDTMNTTGTGDDVVADFSSRGTANRRPDFVAPGRSIVSLRDPGSVIDDANPNAVVTDRFFKGSGTSEAAAVASGAVALLLDRYPDLTPNQVKALLAHSGHKLPLKSGVTLDAGMRNIDLKEAVGKAKDVRANKIPSEQRFDLATGTGSLEAARGDSHLILDGSNQAGEVDAFGDAWNPADPTTWTASRWTGSRWSGSRWSGSRWSGSRWSGSRWSGSRWSGSRWSGNVWNNTAWN
jgi:serine protease AprX